MATIPPIKALLFMKGYSERVPRKNMRLLCGRPLFHWIMDQLVACPSIVEIIINTDSDEIAESARNHYKVTIHMRPEYLLRIDRDEAYQLMAHDLSITEGEYFLQTHSTTPLVTAASINKALELFFTQTEYDSLISVTPVQSRFYWSDGRPINHDPDALIKTQDLPPIFNENSCLYVFSRNVFARRKNRIGYKPMMFPMDPYESIDIDEMLDFELAEVLMKSRLQKQSRD